MGTGMKGGSLYSRFRPQNDKFNSYKTEFSLFLAQVTAVNWEPHEKRHTVDIVIMNARNQKWQNCPIGTHGSGFDRGHIWYPRPEELVICGFAQGMQLSPVIICSVNGDKWRQAYPQRAWMRDTHRGKDATYTHDAKEVDYPIRRYGEHYRHMPRGAFWNISRLGIYRVSDRYETDPLLRGDAVEYPDHIFHHFTAGSEFLELNPKKQHTKLFGRKSVVITATQSGLGSGFIINTNTAKEPDLHVLYKLDDFRPQHSKGRERDLNWPEVDEGAGMNADCKGITEEPKQAYLGGPNASQAFSSQGREPQNIVAEVPPQGEEADHDGCLWLRGAKDVHVNYCRYYRQESWTPKIVDPPCDPYVPKKILAACMSQSDPSEPPASRQHISGENPDGGYLLDTGKGMQRYQTKDRYVIDADKTVRISSKTAIILDAPTVTICNPQMGCSPGGPKVPKAIDPTKPL